MIVALVIIYLWAGIGFAWALDGNGIQRSVTILFWLPLVTYGMVFDLVEWWRAHGYDYGDGEESDEDIVDAWSGSDGVPVERQDLVDGDPLLLGDHVDVPGVGGEALTAERPEPPPFDPVAQQRLLGWHRQGPE